MGGAKEVKGGRGCDAGLGGGGGATVMVTVIVGMGDGCER